MNMEQFHKDLIIVDGLIISNWNRKVFEDMHKGGITAANCTCGVWEGVNDSLVNVAKWKTWFRENNDLIVQIYKIEDILDAKKTNRVGIILGWQNTSGIENHINLIPVFKELGIGVMQITYNTQNLSGSGCYESKDRGLSDFGREVIDEMNNAGIVIDLSHVGEKTSEEVIRHSKKPVAYSHCCPRSLLNHPRNKSDEQIKYIVDKGGFVGVSTYPWFLPKGSETTVDDCLVAFEYVINLIGEDHVGIGTDFTQGQTKQFFDWLSLNHGHGRNLLLRDWEVAPQPIGFQSLSEYPNLTNAMMRRNWSEDRIRKIMGQNWLNFLEEVWNN